jgi:hypothetical protein
MTDMQIIGQAEGKMGRSSCGCLWKTLKRPVTIEDGRIIIGGDVLIRRCKYHLWFSRLPIEQQRQAVLASKAGVQ